MKSVRHGTAAANCKLRGKKLKMLSCGCCCLFNLKDEVKEKDARNQIEAFKRHGR